MGTRTQLNRFDQDEVKNWTIEKRHNRDTNLWFKNECQAYRQLHALQGVYVPRLYGTIELDATQTHPFYSHLYVPGILLEFIEGMTLEELNSDLPFAIKFPHIGEATMDCIDRITRFGVLHDDIYLSNIMVRHDGRVFLVDFAWALFRSDEESEEEWKEFVTREWETAYIKVLLDTKSLRDRTPPAPYTCSIHEYAMFNKLVDNGRECWRERYYEPVVYDSFYDDDNGIECVCYTPSWRLKPEAVAQRSMELAAFRNWGFEEPASSGPFLAKNEGQNSSNGYHDE